MHVKRRLPHVVHKCRIIFKENPFCARPETLLFLLHLVPRRRAFIMHHKLRCAWRKDDSSKKVCTSSSAFDVTHPTSLCSKQVMQLQLEMGMSPHEIPLAGVSHQGRVFGSTTPHREVPRTLFKSHAAQMKTCTVHVKASRLHQTLDNNSSRGKHCPRHFTCRAYSAKRSRRNVPHHNSNKRNHNTLHASTR